MSRSNPWPFVAFGLWVALLVMLEMGWAHW